MAQYYNYCTIYSADDEMPDCGKCDKYCTDYNCEKYCGPEHGWYGYIRTELKKTTNKEKQQ